MVGKIEQVKGRGKEAIGSLTGNKDLQAEGKADRQAGEAKEKLGQAKDRVEKLTEKVEHKAGEMIDRTEDSAHRS
jgi:uncharacterized protein YjbJ (UPF0337 family)